MHSHLEEVFSRLDRARAALRAAVDTVPESARAVKPAPDRWSAAEVVEHLSIVERIFGERIEKAIQARAAGLDRETADRVTLPDQIEARMADRVNKRNAVEAARPTGALACDAAWTAFEHGHERVRAAVVAADGLALGEVTVDHPFFGTLTIYQWIELMAAHEARHTEQIREIAASLAV
jgi:DinB family protein